MINRLLQIRSLGHLKISHLELPRKTGLRILVVSDVHAKDGWFEASEVSKLVEAINRQEGIDAVVMPGDFVGEDAASIDWAAPILGQIEHATYASMGNHDNGTDPERIASHLRHNGITVLINEAIELTSGSWLCGLDSFWGGNPDVERTLHAVPDGATSIVLGHEPVLAKQHTEFLHIAGHTHRGQVRLPLIGDLVARAYYPPHSTPYPYGLNKRRGSESYIYTSPGVGYSVVPFRFNCPPEMTVIDL